MELNTILRFKYYKYVVPTGLKSDHEPTLKDTKSADKLPAMSYSRIITHGRLLEKQIYTVSGLKLFPGCRISGLREAHQDGRYF